MHMTEQPDQGANRVAELLTEFAAELVHKYRVPPEQVAKGAIGLAVTLFLEHRADDERAAAAWLRQFAAEIEEGAAPNEAGPAAH